MVMEPIITDLPITTEEEKRAFGKKSGGKR